MNNFMRVEYFKYKGLIIDYTKSNFNNNNKLQGIVFKIIMSDFHQINNTYSIILAY